LPLVIGPLIASAGFAMFAIPGRDAGYWTGFFPAVVVLGLGMATAVAPLTTTVMSSVKEEQAGIASGVNNAVSRAAGLLAIAIFGVVMLQTFSRSLSSGLQQMNISEPVRQQVLDQRVKLAGIELPNNLPAEQQTELRHAIADSFISGYRLTMFIAAALGLASSAAAWFFIGNRQISSRRSPTT
jgi:hypothetical protein